MSEVKISAAIKKKKKIFLGGMDDSVNELGPDILLWIPNLRPTRFSYMKNISN